MNVPFVVVIVAAWPHAGRCGDVAGVLHRRARRVQFFIGSLTAQWPRAGSHGIADSMDAGHVAGCELRFPDRISATTAVATGCLGAITASIRPNAHVATFRRLLTATCPPRPGLPPSSDVHHQNASRATCAATTELASAGRCFLARRGNTAVRGQVSVVAMRPRAPHCLVLSTPTTEASSVVGRTRAVDAEASSCHWPQTR